MKIAFIYDFLYPFTIGGAEYRYWSLATQLTPKHQITFYSFCFWKNRSENRLRGCEYQSTGVPVLAYSKNGQRRLWEVICFSLGLIKPLWTSKEDIWDISNFPYLSVIIVRGLSLIKKKKMVVTWHEYHGTAFLNLMGGWGWIYYFIEKMALVCSPQIIANSSFTRRRLLSAGLPPHKVKTIPCGINGSLIDASPAENQSYDLIYTGRLEPHKRVGLLIYALKHLHDQGKRLTACIIGEGTEEFKLRKLVQDLGLVDYVSFFSFFPSVQSMYSKLKSARILVQPSKREGFGISVVEGWVCGLPSVVCEEADSALPDLIDHECKGKVVQSNAVAIAQGCDELLQNSKDFYRDKLRQAGMEFDLLSIANQTAEFYEAYAR